MCWEYEVANIRLRPGGGSAFVRSQNQKDISRL